MELKVNIQNMEGEEVHVQTIQVNPRTSIVVKLLKPVEGNALRHIGNSVEQGLKGGTLIVPDWIELTFIEIE